MSAEKLLKFAPFINALDNGFWHKLTQMKLEVYKTNDDPVALVGYYNNSKLHGCCQSSVIKKPCYFFSVFYLYDHITVCH